MTGGDGMVPDPRRTDELLSGAPPGDDAERELLHLAARLRDAQAEVPDALRDRIAGLGEPPPARSLRDRLRGLAGGSPLAAAGAVAGVIAVVAIGAALLRAAGDGPPPVAGPSDSAVEAAPDASAGAGGAPPRATLSAAPESTAEPLRRAPSAAAPSVAAPSVAAPSAAPPPATATDATDLPEADAGEVSATVPGPRAGEAAANAVGRIRAVGGGVTSVRAEPFGQEGVRIEIAGRVPASRLGEVFTGPPAGDVDGAAVRALGDAARGADVAGITRSGAAVVAADAGRVARVPEEGAATATFVLTVAG